MTAFLIVLWLVGIMLRIWRLARFFQIEGYDSRRYLRWLAGRIDRIVVVRALVSVGVAGVAALALELTGQESAPLYLAIWGVAGVMAVWPEPVKEIKQKFKLTQRAIRLLIAAYGLAVAIHVSAVGLAGALVGMGTLAEFAVYTLIGLVTYHLSPLILPLANLIMHPVEAGFRWMFRRRAAATLRRANPVVIGITGSYGKTSTKEYLAHILNGRFRAYATPKSYNTLMGVCIAINNDLSNDSGYDYFIVEMGAYVPGEIAGICDLVKPQISIVTAVGPQHLERFGSLENTARAKYEIIEALPPEGAAVFNWDDPYVRAMYERGYPQTRIGVTWQNTDLATQLRFHARDIRATVDGLRFDVVDTLTGEEQPITTRLVGQHNVTNILLAIATARHLGMSLGEIALRVASLEPAEHRLQRRVLPGGVTVIDDAYSANPVGAQNALNVLSLYRAGRRVLITPGMVELGPIQDEENRKLGRLAAQVCTDIILVGEDQTRPIQQGIRETGFPADRLQVYDTREEAIAWFNTALQPGDTVLFLNDLPDTYL
ncbi:MAG TPA: UDP-N-acetylmuramoyl-tripeptide--D-alanyl-D-alanine ligase [Aggregatilineaceae bacterium]|nr:UDP-N-acetylmuramoyl-tripeptide--D-alanyl-D-alanine ligase [Aggregatilineaceae bacterium]